MLPAQGKSHTGAFNPALGRGMPREAKSSKGKHRDAVPAVPRKTGPPLLIVGIGASAGGLDAFKRFFAEMPADSGMAFVLVQHLAPNHNSLLTELIGRGTAMPVAEAADGEPVQANHVYVIPPDATLTIADGALQVSKPAPPRQHRWPINTFFTSLAQDQGECAVCVVLSGTGSDGARGLRTVKEHGGLTLAQSGFDHAAMTGMPASAAATGLVDHILPVEAMPARLIAHKQHLEVTDSHKGPDGARQDLAAHLRTICGLLRAEVGHDFSQYKEKTLARRVQRRMHVVQTETVPDYIAHLRQHPEEHQQLFREVLIGVTEFFRDPKAFDALQSVAIPKLLSGRGAADTLRVWVPGCATGEEAYSIAIALKESMGRDGRGKRGDPKVQIFATDIDDYAIGAARAGRYKAPLTGISPERQERWFTRDGDDWCVAKSVREMCVFSPHSAIKDPPFSRMDLVSCRNLLIYLNPELQERLVRTFHYALREKGYLLLGTSESLGRNAKLFTVIDKSHRLYQRRGDSGAGSSALSADNGGRGAQPARQADAPMHAGAEDPVDLAARLALEPYSPAYVVIDGNHAIVRFAGDTGRYLGPSTGAASLDLFGLLHRGLRVAARAAVKQAMAAGTPVVQNGLTVRIGDRRQRLRLIAAPLPDGLAGKGMCVLAFDELESGTPSTGAEADGPGESPGAAVQGLERELASVRSELQVAIEQHAMVAEEMQSTSEEYQSVNEELQSANEELETSKEEMQSINEELQTVNAEMHSKNETLTRLNSDLQNLQDSTQIATLFLDSQLRIRSFTPAMTGLYHLRDSDRGRPLTEIAAQVEYPGLRHDVTKVMRTLAVTERVLKGSGDGEDATYLLRMRPYRTVDNVIDGVVLTFVNITERQRAEAERGRLAAIVDSSREMIIGHTLEGTITSWNASAERILGYQAGRVLGKSLSLLVPAGDAGMTRKLLQACEQRQPTELEMEWLRLDGSPVEVAVTCSPVVDVDGHAIAGSLIARDVTERTQAARHLQLMLGELNHRVKNTLASVQAIALQTVAHSSGLEQFRDAFLSRLQALSNTHNLLANDAWIGAGLREVVLGELAPYQQDGVLRVELTGEALQLTPKAALALSMALHELATNAGKYGALSTPQGRVAVEWYTRIEKGQPWLRLLWTEHDGPPITVPGRRGFGSRLIEEGLAFELDGKVALHFEPDGVTCRIDVPLSELVQARNSRPARAITPLVSPCRAAASSSSRTRCNWP